MWGAFVNAGQTCASVERVYVERRWRRRSRARWWTRRARCAWAIPARAEIDIGPLTLERQRAIVEEHVADAVARGAKVRPGGARPDGPGFFYPPTVLTGVDHAMRVMREETFGPVLPIMTVALDEAIRLANDSEYGLTASGWTRDAETARGCRRSCRPASSASTTACRASASRPRPGAASSGAAIGRTHGLRGLREMVQAKYVSRDPAAGPSCGGTPTTSSSRGCCRARPQALHARVALRAPARAAGAAGLGRFRGRGGGSGAPLRNADKLF